MRLAKVAGEEQRIGSTVAECRQKNATGPRSRSWASSHHREVEGRIPGGGDRPRPGAVNMPASVTRFRVLQPQPATRLEDRPEHRPLGFPASVFFLPQTCPHRDRRPRFSNCQASTTCSHSLSKKGQSELVTLDGLRGLAQQLDRRFAAGGARALADVHPVKPLTDCGERMHVDPAPPSRGWLLTSRFNRVCNALGQRIRKTSSAGFGRRDSRERGGTARCRATMVFPVPAEPENPGRPVVIAFHPLPLLGMQEDRPFSPRENPGRGPSSSAPAITRKRLLRVGMLERADCPLRPAAARAVFPPVASCQKGLGRLARQVIGQGE